MAQHTNTLLTLIALGLPAYLVFRSNRFTVPLGAGALWLLVFLCAEASPNWLRSAFQDHPSAMEEWLMGGWAFGLFYAFLLWLLKQCFLTFRRGRLIYQEQLLVGFSAASSFARIWRELNRAPHTMTANGVNTAYFLASSKACPKGPQVRENTSATLTST